MNLGSVRKQIEVLLDRLVASSLSVKQFHPKTRYAAGGITVIGTQSCTSIALRDVPYEDVYSELDANDAYDVKLVDGGLLLFQYRFGSDGVLLQHRLAYFPSPVLPTVDEAPALYENDELYADIIARRLVRFPIRFDYAPEQFADIVHPRSHLTLGQYENCRIPVLGPLGPASFGMFVVRNFYSRIYRKHKNRFDKRAPSIDRIESISEAERRLSHFVQGN
jgi:hypothetical protein